MFSTRNPDFKAVIEDKLERQFFMRHVGFELTAIEEGLIEGKLPIQAFHKQQNLFVHGGVLSTICDIVMGFSAFSLVAPGQHVVTADIRVEYLRPGKGEFLTAKGWVVKPGSSFHFCDAEVYAHEGDKKTLVVRASSTMAVLAADKF